MASNDKLTSVMRNLLTGKTVKLLELMPIMITATATNMPETAAAVGAMLLGDLKAAADKDKILALVEEMIDKKIMEVFNPKNEKHQQLFYLAVETVYKCNRRGKIETVVRILNMSIRTNDVTVNDAEDLMNVVTELSVDEAVLLVMVFKMINHKSDNEKLLSSDIHKAARQETQLHDTKIDFCFGV